MNAALTLLMIGTVLACDERSASSVATPPVASAVVSPSVSSTTPTPTPTPAPSAFVPPTGIAAQHILVAYRGADRAPSGVTRSKANAKGRAAEVDARAKAGEDFTALVAQYSDDPGAKDRLGSLGKFSRGKMDPAFSDAAFRLRVDEVSDVVETRFGFHVIKRNQ